jgi:hypothetical protein
LLKNAKAVFLYTAEMAVNKKVEGKENDGRKRERR